MKRRFRVALYVAIAVYTAMMLWLLFGQRIHDWSMENGYLASLQTNLFPFETVVLFGKIILTGDPAYLIPHAVENLLGNVVMFVPIGVFLPLSSPRFRSLKPTLLTGLIIIGAVELTQFFTLLGSLDFDDFMLNMVGIWIGYVLSRPFWEKFGIDK